MITGAHTLIFSTNPDKDRLFFRNVLKLPNIDVGEEWLIFKLPSSEMAVHPSEKDTCHELYLLCDSIESFVDEMKLAKVNCSSIQDELWGRLVTITLPGGGKLGVYESINDRS